MTTETEEKKEVKLPTADEMKSFSARFDGDQWRRLCINQKFLNLVGEDIGAAAIWAERVLAGKAK